MRGREWYEFADPGEEGVSWRIDVTFLLSRWQCIYGRGCHGTGDVAEANSNSGCCSHGAYFSGAEDHSRVERAARRLRPDQWENYARGSRGVGRAKTPVVQGGCLFLNRADFPGGSGCALHIAATEAGESPIDWKPDVCWQLPLRFRDEGDGRYVIEEFARETWGEGGQSFAWWCTESPEAQVGRKPVYRTLEEELRRIMGGPAYERMARYLGKRKRPIPHRALQA